MKQTAVEWLEKELNLIEENKYTSYIELKIKQAKAMEKEQMCSFAEFVATYTNKNKNYLGEMLHAKSKYDGAERTIDLLEQYYNKNNKSE